VGHAHGRRQDFLRVNACVRSLTKQTTAARHSENPQAMLERYFVDNLRSLLTRTLNAWIYFVWQKEKASHIIVTISIKDSNTFLIILENCISNRRVRRTTFIRTFTYFQHPVLFYFNFLVINIRIWLNKTKVNHLKKFFQNMKAVFSPQPMEIYIRSVLILWK